MRQKAKFSHVGVKKTKFYTTSFSAKRDQPAIPTNAIPALLRSVTLGFRQFWLRLACVGIAGVGIAVCTPCKTHNFCPDHTLLSINTECQCLDRKIYFSINNETVTQRTQLLAELQ